MQRPRVVIIGAGGHGQVVLDALRCQDAADIAGFIDSRAELQGEVVRGGVRVLAADVRELAPGLADHFVVAIGANQVRAERYGEALEAGLQPWTVVHPAATIAASASLGRGCQIISGVIVNPWANLGENCILNTGCTVDHDCQIGNHAFIAPGANLAGGVTVGEYAWVGIGAAVLGGVTIGERSVVGAGAVVTRDLPADVVAYGVPAQIKRNV